MSYQPNDTVLEATNETRAEEGLPPITLQELINTSKTDDDTHDRTN